MLLFCYYEFTFLIDPLLPDQNDIQIVLLTVLINPPFSTFEKLC